MPFTFSHPAVVLPFLDNKKISASALIVGTVSPDLWYFFTMGLAGGISHTLLGVFVVDLPLSILTLFLFHLIVKKALLQNSPFFIQSRTQQLQHFDWIKYFKMNYVTVILSIIFGALTHLGLDSLTHCDGYFVMNFEFYSSIFLGIPFFVYVHLIFSIIGLILIFNYFFKLPVSKQKIYEVKKSYWIWSVIVATIVFFLKHPFELPTDKNGIQTLLVVLFSSFNIGLISVSLIFKNKSSIS
ncbi:DUF4184 family protein [Flavobacterium sp. UMI-01]|uniref:DUF4184 family protein n=1 Tax=Flavobacterium sp. UMI-01 TaxID=1441053 RepID=UPI001C7E1710|nr:DUF4184 family protein [Flavobacterium sp. UMI-01]GIZ07276.1 hypothetical protein FUMI01_00030 [Flavobacterium sp. UMI-01]